jgi:MFS transporter, Spinster family, sphingosine-1-phosphate transporter
LRADVKTILSIPTMRYALVGVSTILFVVTALASWMPTLYERQFHLSQGSANLAFGSLVILAGIPGTLVGGLMADRWINRFLGARVVIPGVCLMISGVVLMVSFIPMPFAGAFALQMVGFLAAASSVPALRAGLSDSVPANLRGTGFGAFNVASIVFGAAAAPILTSAVASQFGGNYRVAFALVMPITFVGAAFLLAARRHIEKDTAKIFEAVVAAMAAENAGP